MSLSSESIKNLVTDAGAIVVNHGLTDERMIGATRGGAQFNVEQTIREIEVDGSPGPLLGGRRVVEEHARITVTLMEMTVANIEMALFGSSSTGDTESTTITRTMTTPGVDAYFTNVALVADISGSSTPAIFKIKNAIADGNFELSTEDQNEGAVEVQFTAHFDPAALDTSPWEIVIPTQA